MTLTELVQGKQTDGFGHLNQLRDRAGTEADSEHKQTSTAPLFITPS
jgi:hypothetical protein